jgi:hypothetical protein
MSQDLRPAADNAMGKRRPNHRLVKNHRSYTVEEIARLFAIHKNTVRRWLKAGLQTIDDKRPMLTLGRDLSAFLRSRRAGKKQHCGIGQLYCVRCHLPKFPAGGMADYLPLSEKLGNLAAICPDCGFIMHRCVSTARIEEVRGKMDITFPQALRQLGEISQPTVNSDLK